MKKILLLAINSLFVSLMSVSAAEVCYSYMPVDADVTYLGCEGSVDLQGAMRVADAGLKGSYVTGVEFFINPEAEVEELEIFLSYRIDKSLKTVYTQSATPDENGHVSVILDTPYKMSVNSLYAGYTIKCANDVTSLLGVTEPCGIDDSCYYRVNGEAWRPGAEEGTLAMKVYFDGDFNDFDLAISSVSAVNAVKGEEDILNVVVSNTGAGAIRSLDYVFDYGDQTVKSTVNFEPEIPALFGASREIEIPVSAYSEPGSYPSQLRITGINGAAADISAPVTYNVVSYRPVNRPLFEEYTGTWCGACVEGMASMDMMNDKYGEDFVEVSIHGEDELTFINPFPNTVTSYPSAWINRTVNTHPCTGNSGVLHGIEQVWLEEQSRFTPASISVKAWWNGEEKTEVKSEATVEFVVRPSDNDEYRIGYVLVGSGLTSSEWHQANYSSGAQTDDPYLGKYASLPSYIENPVYDHTAILYPSLDGIAGSLPSILEMDVPMTHDYSMALADAFAPLVQDKEQLEVVAFLINVNTGEVVNACKAHVAGFSSVSTLQSNEVITTEYYTLTGIKALAPVKGAMMVRVETYADGSRSASKIIY